MASARFFPRLVFLASLGGLLVACAPGPIDWFEVSGSVARPGARGIAFPVQATFALRQSGTVSAAVVGPTGEWSLRDPIARRPGEVHQIAFDGTIPSTDGRERTVLPNGAYELRLRVIGDTGARDERSVPVMVESVDGVPLGLDGPRLSLAAISPDGDGVEDEVQIGYTVSKEATVEIWAVSERGDRATIQGPTARNPGAYVLPWDGSAGGRVFGGKRLPDGKYAIAMQATDRAGNMRYREAPLVISNGGIERLEIAEVTFTPTRVRVGDTLRARIRVVNTGETTTRTMAPSPSSVYRASESFSDRRDATGSVIRPEAGAWRVGVGWQGATQELPLRWGLAEATVTTIAPGAEVILDVAFVVDLPPNPAQRFWVGIVREGVGLSGGRVGDRVIEITP
ncbi:MAG: hypothetical protein EPO26_10240 [Chloroflexota bacterium]|nr:MAG: hypothetical protein EPO26_10240 [Chloroflexota bacterium]